MIHGGHVHCPSISLSQYSLILNFTDTIRIQGGSVPRNRNRMRHNEVCNYDPECSTCHALSRKLWQDIKQGEPTPIPFALPEYHLSRFEVPVMISSPLLPDVLRYCIHTLAQDIVRP